MQNGTIKKLVIERGFGFIAADDGQEYFFHRCPPLDRTAGLSAGQRRRIMA